jgi:FkbM family methyltransferase
MLKRLLRPAYPVIKQVIGPSAPALRYVLRHAPEPQRRLFWRLVGSKLSRGAWEFTTESNYGFKMQANTVDLLGRYVYYFGVWEPDVTTWILGRLREGDTFIDVGANFGYFALLASRIVGPSGHVVAIEASPRILQTLTRNLALNGADNVRVVNVAVTDREGELEIYDGPAYNSGRTSVLQQEGLRRGGTVATKPLPAILTDAELSGARIFKIDVEGAEQLVVQGLRDALPRTQAAAEFVIELSPLRLAALGQTARDILDVFAGAGFNAYAIAQDFSFERYLERPVYAAPKRVTDEILVDTDVVFSRLDEASL